MVDLMPLSSATAQRDTVGGKGANLAKLVRAGMPVPDGFLLPVEPIAFCCGQRAGPSDRCGPCRPRRRQSGGTGSSFVAHPCGFMRRARWRRHWGGAGRTVWRHGRTAGGGALFGDSRGSARHVVRRAAGHLFECRWSGCPMRCRRGCWSSLWTARAIGYRARNGVDRRAWRWRWSCRRMVDAQASGVLFTANPLSGRRTETAIDATLGLGEALVSGQVEPDHYVVDHGGQCMSGRNFPQEPGRQGHGDPGAGRWRNGHEQAGEPELPGYPRCGDSGTGGVGRQGAGSVRVSPGHRMGVGWAPVYLLQARPITSLYPTARRNATIAAAGDVRALPQCKACLSRLRRWDRTRSSSS